MNASTLALTAAACLLIVWWPILVLPSMLALLLVHEYMPHKPEPRDATVSRCCKSISIEYRYDGRLERVNLPYDPAVYRAIDMYVESMDGRSSIDITQQEGIPLLVEASELGGSRIVCYDRRTGARFIVDGLRYLSRNS